MSDRLSHTSFFPYPEMRRGQEEMMQVIESSVSAGKNICCEAPNGFGKTCVTLSGVLPWVKENRAKVLYCARTHRQLDRVMEELYAISGRQDVTGISFRGRQHMCLNQFVLENADFVAPLSEVCGQLKATGKCSYHEHMKKLIASDDPFEDMPKRILTASDIVGIAKGWSVCPYEMAKSLAKGADVVALSYLYVFDPFIFESFMPDLGVPMSKVVLVEDEAHNVPFTALDSASDSLPVGTARQAMKEAETYNDSVSRVFCRGLAKAILEISSGMEENEERIIKPLDIYSAAVKASELTGETQIVAHMAETGLKIKKGLLRAGKLPRSAIHRVAEFLGKWLRYAERDDYAFIMASERGTGDSRKVSLDLLALDPTSVTSPILKLVHSSVAVSGTLSPLDAYTDMLGLGPETVKVAFRSPFGAESRIGIIVEGLDTSYEGRNETLFQHMVEHCVAVVNATPGNTGVFASSYSVAESLLKAGLEKKLKRRLFVEKQGMKTGENDIMIEDFKSRGDKGGAVLLGVQGGRNSEGGDFPGPAMESVVVVGVPYAKPTPRTEALIEYFDKRFNGRGRQYAYVLPSMTRAIQAAGRPVRRPSDRGAIVFLDKRFATRYLRRFMPSWLDEVTRTMPDDPSAVGEKVAAFFSN
jgi:DNA excision repair protein ERCC-2